MQVIPMKFTLLAAAMLIQSTSSFAPIKTQHIAKASSTSPFSSQPLSAIKGEDAMECYIIDPEEICDEEGCVVPDENPTIVCTSEPQEYAWYNGIDEKRMHKAEGDVDIGASQCVESASPRGVEEWECAP